jgi:DNA gyrase/topoisomerase IV subunit A
MATKNGLIKKTALKEYDSSRTTGLLGITLKENDELIGVRLTDGEDNEDNGSDLSSVNQMISDLRKNEAWAQSFTISMLGVGDDSSFRRSCTNMGLDPDKVLSTIGTSASEIRKQMGVVSQSVSQSNVGSSVSF